MSVAEPDAILSRMATPSSPVYALTALFLVCVATRFQVSLIPPLLPRIEAEFATSHTWGGLLNSLSFAMMGFGALAAPAVLRALGSTRAIAVMSGAIALSGAARAIAPDALSVTAIGIPIGLAIGLATALMPVVAKERFPERAGLSTGVYVTGISIGSTVAFALAVPLADALGGWRMPLLTLAGVAVVLSVPWSALPRLPRPTAGPMVGLPRLPPSGLAWLAIVIFSLQSILFFGLNTWLPSAFVEHGWPEATAGLLGSGLIASSLLGSVAVSLLPDSLGWTDRYLIVAALAAVVGSFGLVLFPAAAWTWTALAGASTGALLVLSLRLPLELGNVDEVAGLSGLMLAVGYWTGGIAPVVLGGLRDASGAFGASFIVLGILSIGLVAASVWFAAHHESVAHSRGATRG